jgi:anti-sigma B factor antagonist
LVSSFTAVNKEGGTLKLLKLTQKIQDLLAITKLLTVFDVFDEESEALSSFA